MTTVQNDPQSESSVVHLVVDMQKRYVKNLKPQDSADIVRDLGAFIEKTSDKIRPIHIETVDEEMYWAAGEELESYSSVFNRKGSDNLRVEKTYSSPFKYGRSTIVPMEHTEINRQLQKLGAKTVLVSGLYEDLCVWETARDAASLGYDVVILKDLCRNAKNAEPGSQWLAEKMEIQQKFFAAHSNIRFGKSTEFVDANPICRAASHSVGAPAPEFV